MPPDACPLTACLPVCVDAALYPVRHVPEQPGLDVLLLYCCCRADVAPARQFSELQLIYNGRFIGNDSTLKGETRPFPTLWPRAPPSRRRPPSSALLLRALTKGAAGGGSTLYITQQPVKLSSCRATRVLLRGRLVTPRPPPTVPSQPPTSTRTTSHYTWSCASFRPASTAAEHAHLPRLPPAFNPANARAHAREHAVATEQRLPLPLAQRAAGVAAARARSPKAAA